MITPTILLAVMIAIALTTLVVCAWIHAADPEAELFPTFFAGFFLAAGWPILVPAAAAIAAGYGVWLTLVAAFRRLQQRRAPKRHSYRPIVSAKEAARVRGGRADGGRDPTA